MHGGAGLSRQMSTGDDEIEEVELWDGSREERKWRQQADMYATFVQMECLEEANARVPPDVEPAVYYEKYQKLYRTYKSSKLMLDSQGIEIDAFCTEYGLTAADKPLAFERLVNDKQPNPPAGGSSSGKDGAQVASITHHFIGLTDALKMEGEMVAKDSMHPVLTDLMGAMSKAAFIKDDWEGMVMTRKWLGKLATFSAGQELDEDQVRECMFEVDSAYASFHKLLEA